MYLHGNEIRDQGKTLQGKFYDRAQCLNKLSKYRNKRTFQNQNKKLVSGIETAMSQARHDPNG